MKSRNFWGWLKIGVVVVVPLFVVLTLWARSNGENTKGEPEAVSASASVAATNSAESTEVLAGDANLNDADQMEVDEPDPGEFASSTNAVPVEVVKPAAADVKLSDGALELVKMAQSGVDEQVMLAFVTNYPSKFNLGSDQIIYLNDLGVSGNVVRSMIERDAALGAMVAQAAVTNLPPGVVTNGYAETYPTNLYYPPTNYVDQPVVDSGYSTAPGYGYDNGYVGGDDSYFYSSLQPYGSWIYVSGYGRCWQPTVCVGNRNWQPYCDRGRWVYTDCGWYWQSDYSWGWAPFHYGRWFCDDQFGWVWRPGRTWGPAWVSWRNSSDYCGWAPLPPEARWTGGGFRYWNRSVGVSFEFGLSANRYCFVPVNRFCDYAPYRHRVGSGQVVNVYNHTKVVNNFTVKDHKVVNHGIDPKHVAQVTRTEIRTVKIKDAPAGGEKTARPDRLDRNSGSLAVIRPQLPPRPVVGSGTHADGKANDRGNGWHRNGAAGGSGLVSTPRPPKSGDAITGDRGALGGKEGTTASNGKPVVTKPTGPGVPSTGRNPWPGRERDVVPPTRGEVAVTPRPQAKPGDAPSKAVESGSTKESPTASVGQPAVSKPASPFTPVTGPKQVVDSERKDLPAKSIVPIFTKREPAASPVGGATAGATSIQNNGNAGANHFIRPQTPSVVGSAGSGPVTGRNTGSSGRETYPPNSLVLIGKKQGNDSAQAQPAANASGLPNMNLANVASRSGSEAATSQYSQSGNVAQNSGAVRAANPFSGAGNSMVVPTPGQAPARAQTPITTQNQVGGNSTSAAQAAQMQALMSRWQNANKPAAAPNTSPAVKDSPVSAAPRWNMPAQSSPAPSWGSRAESHVTPPSAVTTPTPAPRPSYTPPAASSVQSAPAYRSAPAETRSAPVVRSSPAPSYSAPAQRSAPPSSPSRDTSSGSTSGKSRP